MNNGPGLPHVLYILTHFSEILLIINYLIAWGMYKYVLHSQESCGLHMGKHLCLFVCFFYKAWYNDITQSLIGQY